MATENNNFGEKYVDEFDYIAVQYLGGIQSEKSIKVLLYSAVLRNVAKSVNYIGWERQKKYKLHIKSTRGYG